MKFEIEKFETKNWWRLIIECGCGETHIVPLENIPIYEIERIFGCKTVIRRDSSTGRALD